METIGQDNSCPPPRLPTPRVGGNAVPLRRREPEGDGRLARVPLDSLLPADSPRLGGEDPDHVRLLAEAPGPLPPILVHRATMRVVDGMHRLRAAALRGDTGIAVEFFDGSEIEAFARGVRENVTHGLPLSRAEREAAAARMIAARGEWSNRALAEVTGLSPTTVAAIRARSTGQAGQSNARVGRDGRYRPVDPAEGRLRARTVIAERPGASLREIATEAGISISTARDVRQRVQRGEDPVPGRAKRRSSPRRRVTELKVAPPAGAGLDPAPILRSLRRDPSLRFSETGRTLLQWLGVHEMAADGQSNFIESIPPHCRENVARLAWGCAEIWAQLAQDLQQHEGEQARSS